MNDVKAAEMGLAEDDWVWVESYHGRNSRAGVFDGRRRSLDGVDVECHRQAVRRLELGCQRGRSEKKGFLLNHVISELLPPRDDGYRYANSDPVTGQAAWYDLRVHIKKADPAEDAVTFPQFDPTAKPAGLATPADTADVWRRVQKGAGQAMTTLPTSSEKKLGLVIDLDICVGCHACAVNCKEWNSGGHAAPLTDRDAYGDKPIGVWFKPHPHV